MNVSFAYTLKVDARAISRQTEEEVSFSVSQEYEGEVADYQDSPMQAKSLNPDIDEDGIRDPVRELMNAGILDYCQTHDLLFESLEVDFYHIDTDAEEVKVYFNLRDLPAFTSDGSAFIHAYFLYAYEAPLPPVGLKAEATDAEVLLTWENVASNADGYHIYTNEGRLLHTTLKDVSEWTDKDVGEDAFYTYVVTSFNTHGESLERRVSIQTSKKVWDIEDVTVEPIEREDGPLRAFQSGVGDHHDLKIQIDPRETPRELFTFDTQIKGYVVEDVNVYPKRALQYRIRAENADFGIVQSPWYEAVIDGQEPLNHNGAGKKNSRLPIQVKHPATDNLIYYYIELKDSASDINFFFEKSGKDTTSDANDYVVISSKPTAQKTRTKREAHYGTRFEGQTDYVLRRDDTLRMEGYLIGPLNDEAFRGKQISEWTTIVTTSNSNVRLWLEDVDGEALLDEFKILPEQTQVYAVNQERLLDKIEFTAKSGDETFSVPASVHVKAGAVPTGDPLIIDYYVPSTQVMRRELHYMGIDYAEERTHLDVKVNAQIINPRQTSWHPQIHNGYYYLNQAEHFLYNESHVSGPYEFESDFAPYSFTYTLEGIGKHYDPPREETIIHENAHDFLGEHQNTFYDPTTGAIVLAAGATEGVYISPNVPLEGPVRRHFPFEWKSVEENGSSVQLFAAVVSSSMEDIPWDDLWEPIEKDEIPILSIGDIMRYKIELTGGDTVETSIFNHFDGAESQFNEGVLENVAYTTEGGLTKVDVGSSGMFTSRTIDAEMPVNQFESIYVLGEGIDSIEIASQAADTNWDAAVWKAVPLDEFGTAAPDFGGDRYTKYRIKFPAGAEAKVVNVEIGGSVIKAQVVSPRFHSLTVPIEYNERVTDGFYTRSVITEVLADEKRHRITSQTIKQLIVNAIVASGINPDQVVWEAFRVSTANRNVVLSIRNPAAPEEILDETEAGDGVVYAATTRLAERYVYENMKINVGTDNTSIVHPIPRQGAPVIIKDASGRELTQVSFYNSEGQRTLQNTEDMHGDGTNELLLSHVDVDTDSLTIFIYDQALKGWKEEKSFAHRQNRVFLERSISAETPVRIQYKLLHSFYVDMRYRSQDDYVKIHMHKPVLDDSRELHISYETNRASPYYTAEEINLNTMYNIQHSGFIYLSNSLERARKIMLQVNPKTMFANQRDATIVRAVVVDQWGNPVPNHKIHFTATKGVLSVIQDVTDLNGLAVANYYGSGAVGQAVIKAVDLTDHLEAQDTIQLVTDVLPSRIVLSTNDDVMGTDETHQIAFTATVIANNQEPLEGVTLNFTTTFGTVASNPNVSDFYGKVHAVLTTEDVPDSENIQVTAHAPSLKVTESFNILVNDDHRFLEGSYNLQDVEDHRKARANWGITTGSKAPVDVKDIWMEVEDDDV